MKKLLAIALATTAVAGVAQAQENSEIFNIKS